MERNLKVIVKVLSRVSSEMMILLTKIVFHEKVGGFKKKFGDFEFEGQGSLNLVLSTARKQLQSNKFRIECLTIFGLDI